METIDELTEIQHRLIAAWAAGDASVHQHVLANDWSVIDPAGRTMTKAEVLAESFTGERDLKHAVVDEIKVRDLGEFAIVTGRTRVAGTIAGQEVDVVLKFTDVFRRAEGEWKCLASQGTLVSS
jgi:ketosteroid isomerase-like protein